MNTLECIDNLEQHKLQLLEQHTQLVDLIEEEKLAKADLQAAIVNMVDDETGKPLYSNETKRKQAYLDLVKENNHPISILNEQIKILRNQIDTHSIKIECETLRIRFMIYTERPLV